MVDLSGRPSKFRKRMLANFIYIQLIMATSVDLTRRTMTATVTADLLTDGR